MVHLRNQATDSTSKLEDIFLELTGVFELQTIIQALRTDKKESARSTGAKE